MKIGFIGLGNVGGKLAGNLTRNGADITVFDLDAQKRAALVAIGAHEGQSATEVAKNVDVIITCLPSPEISANLMESEDGLLSVMAPGKIWLEMSTTDHNEVKRLGALVNAKGAEAVDCPVSGGCHRAATGNISIFAGCPRETFEKILPLLTKMGRRILHTGPLGSASILKVATNYLATANLVSITEALVTMKAANIDLATTYEAFKISSGNSFVHETESQVILNGSRDVNFTMDLVKKDIGLFQAIADDNNVPLDLSPLIVEIFDDGIKRYGERAQSDQIIQRLEEATNLSVLADGFPAEIVDDEPSVIGAEVHVKRS